jgi:glycosyltransferase involved in cell wall biosynthesis
VAPALQRLARDGALRAELRARGLARAAELSWERCAELTAGVYSNVLAR